MNNKKESADNDYGWDELTGKKLTKRCRSKHRHRYWKTRNKEEYNCPKCGRGCESVRVFELHHIDHNPLNGLSINLIALCQSCHYKIHGRTPPETLSDWKSNFLEIGESKA